MTTELKACPFCGSTDVEVTVDARWIYVHCKGCNTNGQPDLKESIAIEAWNTRPLEDALQKRVEELEAVLKLAEWSGDDQTIGKYCPICEELQVWGKHSESCELGNALGREP